MSELVEITPAQNSLPTSANQAIFDPQNLRNLMDFAEVMATADSMIPDHLKGKKADCLAVAMQANRWEMDPFVVAQKTHIVNGTLGYEAQLVNAVISSSKATVGSFHYKYSDGWEKLNGKAQYSKQQRTGRNGGYEVQVPTANWSREDELGLWVKVGAKLAGDTEITWGEELYLANILTRNSPLWVTAPKQQIAYLAVKYWSRLYTPQVILGVYDKDELQQPTRNHQPNIEKDITPTPSSSDINAALAKKEQYENTVEADVISETQDQAHAPSKFEQVKGLITTVTDFEGYSEAAQLYKSVKGDLTEDERRVLVPLFTSAHSKYK